MNPAFPEGYSEWRKVEPRELIYAQLVKEPVQKSVHKALRKQAKDADSVVIATDYDREGELIGLEALEEMLDANPKLAANGRARRRHRRQARPLLGAHQGGDRGGVHQPRRALRAACPRRRGAPGHRPDLGRDADPLRVARDRSPRLAVPVRRPRAEPDARDRRRARARAPRARARSPTGRCSPRSSTPTASSSPTTRWTSSGRRPRRRPRSRTRTRPGVVKSVESKRNTRKPPAPFNTTAFTSAASSVGRLAGPRDAHRRGPLHGRVHLLPAHRQHRLPEVAAGARAAAARSRRCPRSRRPRRSPSAPELEPTRGKKETTDHPPIYPTQALDPSVLPDDGHRKIYELVVRRFLATFADPSVSESTRADIEAGSRDLLRARQRAGRAGLPGGLSIRALQGRGDPEGRGGPAAGARGGASAAGRRSRPTNPWFDAKETQPPSRIGQGKLIEMMEERGLGTKATRHDIIQKLYDRGYVQGNPIEPRETGIAMVKAFQQYAERVATPDMTAELEADMDKIASGEVTKDEVLEISRKMLRDSYDLMDEHKQRARQDHLGGHGPGPDPGPVPASAARPGARTSRARPTACGSSARRSRASASSAARATRTATRPTASRSAAT